MISSSRLKEAQGVKNVLKTNLYGDSGTSGSTSGAAATQASQDDTSAPPAMPNTQTQVGFAGAGNAGTQAPKSGSARAVASNQNQGDVAALSNVNKAVSSTEQAMQLLGQGPQTASTAGGNANSPSRNRQINHAVSTHAVGNSGLGASSVTHNGDLGEFARAVFTKQHVRNQLLVDFLNKSGGDSHGEQYNISGSAVTDSKNARVYMNDLKKIVIQKFQS